MKMKKFTDIGKIFEAKNINPFDDDSDYREDYNEEEMDPSREGDVEPENHWWTKGGVSEPFSSGGDAWEFFKRKKEEELLKKEEEEAAKQAELVKIKKQEQLKRRRELEEEKKRKEEEQRRKQEEERLRKIEEEKKKRKTFQEGDVVVVVKPGQGKLPLEAWEFLRTYKRFKVLSLNENGKINLGCHVTRDGVSKLYFFSTKRFELESVVKSGGYKPPSDDGEDEG
jgi:alanyl-tRNA synthetase